MEEPKQHILLAITGLSPQVVTETVYALHQLGKPVLSRIVIITTVRGAEEVQTHLLKEGKLQQLCSDYNMPHIELTVQDILVVPDENGQPMNDALSHSDHTAMSDFICDTVRNLCNDSNTCIHASIAGGRKTMTFLLGYAMSLFGRKQDSLSHTLVTEGYESSQFFYPTPYSQQVYLRSGSRDAKDAEVLLAFIPFVRLREEFPEKLLNGNAAYSETVKWLNIEVEGQELTLNIIERTVSYCGYCTILTPVDFAFYLWLCKRASSNLEGLPIPVDSVPELSYANEFLLSYQWYIDGLQMLDLKNGAFNEGMERAYFDERKSRVNTELKKIFGTRLTKLIGIYQLGKVSGRNVFGLAIQSQRIKIIGD